MKAITTIVLTVALLVMTIGVGAAWDADNCDGAYIKSWDGVNDCDWNDFLSGATVYVKGHNFPMDGSGNVIPYCGKIYVTQNRDWPCDPAGNPSDCDDCSEWCASVQIVGAGYTTYVTIDRTSGSAAGCWDGSELALGVVGTGTVGVENSGIPAQETWYDMDIVMDVNASNQVLDGDYSPAYKPGPTYDSTTQCVDPCNRYDMVDKDVCGGFRTLVPEFATIAIPAIAVLGLFLIFNKRKHKKD